MSAPGARGPVVVDTNVFGLALRPSPLAEQYRPIVEARPLVVSFVTVAELRYGARRAQWGEVRRRHLARLLGSVDVVHSGEVIDAYADLRARCETAGHGLSGKIHEADRWIAATAVWLAVPLVTHDRIFLGVEGLDVLTVLDVDI